MEFVAKTTIGVSPDAAWCGKTVQAGRRIDCVDVIACRHGVQRDPDRSSRTPIEQTDADAVKNDDAVESWPEMRAGAVLIETVVSGMANAPHEAGAHPLASE